MVPLSRPVRSLCAAAAVLVLALPAPGEAQVEQPPMFVAALEPSN